MMFEMTKSEVTNVPVKSEVIKKRDQINDQ